MRVVIIALGLCVLLFAVQMVTASAQALPFPEGVSTERRVPDPDVIARMEAKSRAAEQIIRQGNVALELKQYTKAESLFRNALAIEIRPRAWLGLAEVYEKQNRTDSAIGAYRRLIYPGPYEPHGSIGIDPTTKMRFVLLLIKAGQWDEASSVYEAAISNERLHWPNFPSLEVHFTPETFNVRQMEAMAHLVLGFKDPDHEQATHEAKIAHLQQAVKIAPRMALAHFYLGYGLQRAGRFEEAKAAYTKTVSLASREPELKAKAQDFLTDVIALIAKVKSEEKAAQKH